MGMRFNTAVGGDGTGVADRVRIVDLADDGTSNIASAAVATGVPLTMAYWCKPPSWNRNTSVRMTDLCLYGRAATGGATSKWIYELQIDGAGTSANALDLRSRRITGTGTVTLEATAYAPTSSGFVHICGVWIADGASNVDSYLYIDGTLNQSNTASTIARPENGRAMDQTMIGAGGAVNTTNSGANGQENRSTNDIFEVCIWQAQLSDDEIASLAKGFRPSLIKPSKLKLYVPGIRGTWASPYGPTASVGLSTASPAARLKTQADSTVTVVDHIRRIG